MEFTLKDLLIEGLISKHELRDMAARVFNGSPVVGVDGYVVTLPVFKDLDDRLQGYIVKVLLEAPAVDILSSTTATPPPDSLDDGKLVMFPGPTDDPVGNDTFNDNDPDDEPSPLVA